MSYLMQIQYRNFHRNLIYVHLIHEKTWVNFKLFYSLKWKEIMLIIVFQWYWVLTFSSTIADFFHNFFKKDIERRMLKVHKTFWTQIQLAIYVYGLKPFCPEALLTLRQNLIFFYFVFLWNLYTDRIFFVKNRNFFTLKHSIIIREKKTTEKCNFQYYFNENYSREFYFISILFFSYMKVLRATIFF